MSKMPFIKSIIVLLPAVVFTACSTPSSNSTLGKSDSQPNNSNSITCYEKTPTCYVSQGAPGCLTISYEKPANSDGTRTCILPASEKNVAYPLRGNSSQPYVAQ